MYLIILFCHLRGCIDLRNEMRTTLRNAALVFVMGALLALTACGSVTSGSTEFGDISEQNLDTVCAALDGAGLSNVDVFREWVDSYLAGDESDAEVSGFSDADCRMTVMLLAGDHITSDRVENNYDGTYLMFDLEAIQNQNAYSILQDKQKLFTTLFGEMPIPKSGFGEAFPDRLKKYGIRFGGEKFSIISLLFKAYGEEQAFVGHTGILVDCRENADVESDFLFVEKIGFGDAYKATPVNDDAELLQVLSQRPDYSVEDGDPTPLVYKNDTLLGGLSK